MTIDDSDGALLDRSAAGDREAFGLLYDRHVRAVFAQALGVVGEPDLAQDVAQDVFITCWTKIRSVRVVDESVLPWLMVTARYHALNAGRRRQRDRQRTHEIDATTLDRGLPDDDTVESLIDRDEVQAEIDKAVATLSDVDRRVYDLCVDGDHTYESAARTLGLSHGAVRNRLSRVRARLRADLRAVREPA